MTALGAAALFGVSAPFAKQLVGELTALLLAGLPTLSIYALAVQS